MRVRSAPTLLLKPFEYMYVEFISVLKLQALHKFKKRSFILYFINKMPFIVERFLFVIFLQNNLYHSFK